MLFILELCSKFLQGHRYELKQSMEVVIIHIFAGRKYYINPHELGCADVSLKDTSNQVDYQDK